jgi:hypothetical protein
VNEKSKILKFFWCTAKWCFPKIYISVPLDDFLLIPQEQKIFTLFLRHKSPKLANWHKSPKLVSSDLLNPFHTGPKRTTFSDDQLGDQLGQPPNLGL